MNNSNNNHTQASGDGLSWLVVLICLFAALPLGIILLLVKLSNTTKDKGARSAQRYYQSNQKPWSSQNQRPAASQANTGRPNDTARPFWQPAANRPSQQYYEKSQAAQPSQNNQKYPSQSRAATAQSRPATSQPSYQYYNVKENADKNAQKENAKAAKKRSGKGLSALLMFLGVLFTLTGTVFLSLGISSYAAIGLMGNTITMGIFSAIFFSSALFSFFERGFVQRRFRRFNKYSAVIGNHETMPIVEIAKAVGASVKKTHKTLQDMIDSGCFGPLAYIDSGLDSFVLSHEAAEKVRMASEAAEKTRTSSAEKPAGSENQYVAIINELHMLCGQTIDPDICANIHRIEELTAKIFKIVEEKPEKAPQIRRFMNYYLPTTLKLLHSYETLEKQGISGENIMSAKLDIERILETLATGYEQQLDNLFRADAIDISADINVLENLMEQDGLTNEGNILKTAGGN
jgi:hypothetical protein